MWCHDRVLNHFNWAIAKISRSESESWWARDKWSLQRRVSLAILSPEHLQNDMLIESAWPNTDIARTTNSKWWWMVPTMPIILLWNSAFCFGITSHPLPKHVLLLSLCCFEINRCLTFYSDKNILIKLQHVIKNNQSWRYKVFWLQKWLDACWNDMRWPNKFWALTWN